MRVYWIFVTVIAVAGVGFVAGSFHAATDLSRASKMSGTSIPVASISQVRFVQTMDPPPAAPVAAPQEPVKKPAEPAAANPAPAAPVKVAHDPPAAKPTPSAPVTPAATAPAAKSNTPVGTPPTGAVTGAKPADGTAKTDGVEKIGGYEIMPGKVEKKEDGSLVLDDKFTVKGLGTKESPYEVTWELLTSADQDFDPHSNKKKLPQRIAMLHDKYVKLGGWIAFPMNMQQPKELLLMLNQWDGCCIGVPPTPYDAIEVGLNKVVTGDDRFTTTAAIVGKFGVKPYVVGDWLVGLYTMEQGELKPKFGGAGTQ